MPRIIEYTENEGTAQTSANTMMQLINSSKNSTAGLAGFQIKTIVVSSVSAVIFGQASSMLLTQLVGPGLSFLGGAAFGYLGGLIHRYNTDVREATEAFLEYPQLMEHHLKQADPLALRNTTFREWTKIMRNDPVRQGYAIAALYSASPAIQRIRDSQEEDIIAAVTSSSRSIDNTDE